MSDSLAAATGRDGSRYYGFLLISLCALLTLPPFLQGFPLNGLFFKAAWTVTMLVGAVASGASPRGRKLVLALAVGAALPDWLFTGNQTVMSGLRLVFTTGLFGYLAIAIWRHVSHAKLVDRSIVQGSVCGYLMLGIVWAMLFSFIDMVLPGSLHVGGQPLVFSQDNLEVILYFSFVTLTTLGYGDVLPVTDATRMLATLEAASGQIYLAIVVARLVGVRVAQQAANRASHSAGR